MTKEEQLINFFLDKYQKGDTNEVTISKNDCETLNISEEETSRIIHTLQEDGLLTIQRKSIHNNFSMYWTIALKTNCLHYFDYKDAAKVEKRNNWIKFWIPVVLSAIAIIVSIVALVLGK